MTPDTGAHEWYAIWTRSRHERHVHDQLVDGRIEAFLPTIKRWSRWKDRRKLVEWPLFPGYCFARFAAAQRLQVLKCRGVVGIVSVDGSPAPVPALEIESIKVLVNHTLAFDPCPLLHEGDVVQVRSGPLCGIVGRLLRKDSHRATVVLSVTLIAQAIRVEVDAADISRH